MLINMELLVNLEISLFFRQHDQQYKNYNVKQGAFTWIFSLGNQRIKFELIALSWLCNNIWSPRIFLQNPMINSDRSKSDVNGLKISVPEPVIFQNKILSMRNPIHPWRHRRLDHQSISLIRVTGTTHHEIFVSISGQFDEWPRLNRDFPRSSYTITIPKTIQKEYQFHLLNNNL